MSGLHMWAPRFLFLWQLLWLQVQAAPIPELAVDSILLNSISLEPSEQNPANIEVSSLNDDPSAVLSESPSLNPLGALAQLPTQQDASAQSTVSSQPLKFLFDYHQGLRDKHHPPALPPVPLPNIQTSRIHGKGRHEPPKSYKNVEVYPSHQKATDSRPYWGKVQHRLLPIGVKDVDLGFLITSKPHKKIVLSAVNKVSSHHAMSTRKEQPTTQQESPALSTSEADAIALKQTAAPPKHPVEAFPLPEPVQAQWPSIPPVDLGLTITPEHTLGTAAPALQQTAILPLKPGVTFPLPEPVQAQQPTFLPLELELPIIPESTLEAGATALQPNAAPAKHPLVTLPRLETVQAHQPTFPPLDLGLPSTPESTLETGATAPQSNAAPAKHPLVTLPPPETVQAQQPTFPPLDLGLPSTPESTLEIGATALQPNAAPAKHPLVTLPPLETVQV